MILATFTKGSHTKYAHDPAEVVALRFEGWTESPPPAVPAKNARKAAWAGYADTHRVPVPDSATRSDIVTALDTAGVPTEPETHTAEHAAE